MESAEYVELDGYTFKLEKTGYYFGMVGTQRIPMHKYVWEKKFGVKQPEGFHIHHIDCVKTNNDPENLILMDESSHHSLHARMHIDKVTESLLNYAVPAAKKWHRSEEGRAWHREHAKEVAEKVYAEKTAECICEYCGSKYMEYESLVYKSRFCSNKCKSAWRRASGVDDETRECLYCGKEFVTNKYSKTKCCSVSCSAKQRWVDRRQKTEDEVSND